MTRNQILRRVGILCCHCLRNISYYRAGWQGGKLIFKDQFCVTANGNFLDICIMEWCKLFGDTRGKHYWKKVITDKEYFYNSLLNQLKISNTDFDSYIEEMRTYRDKFIAHLDSENTAHIPKLEIAKTSVMYLYDYLLTHEDRENCFPDAPKKASEFYRRVSSEGKQIYNK